MTGHRRRLMRHRSPVALPLLALLFIAACSSDAVGPTTPAFTLAHASDPTEESAVLLWNRTARNLVSRYQEVPPRAARGYALLSVAQLKVLSALRDRRPGEVSRLERSAIAGASSTVLAALFPAAADAMDKQVRSQLPTLDAIGEGNAGEATRAYNLGREVGQRVMSYAATDGADRVWDGAIPIGDGYWRSSVVPPVPPMLPLWGQVRPWFLRAGEELRPQAPPVFGSAEFLHALADVRRISDTRTDEQLRVARFWADGPGTATPPGHWNEIAATLIAEHPLTEFRAAWILALLNMVLMDASISCWDAKYAFWLLRPSQADPRITTPVGLPNFPSYTSGHATFSGAAAEILGGLFPAQRHSLTAMAEEAARSRLYAGIHYRFDNE
ncbi:MAG: vanadium-dependent haloperoxidase, partial [Gammaproteobacteria bacterium]